MADEPVPEVEEVLLLRAEIFRSKLIEHFQLLDALTDKDLEEEIPKYHSDEVTGIYDPAKPNIRSKAGLKKYGLR